MRSFFHSFFSFDFDVYCCEKRNRFGPIFVEVGFSLSQWWDANQAKNVRNASFLLQICEERWEVIFQRISERGSARPTAQRTTPPALAIVP